MALNRRRHANIVPVGGIVKWIVLVLFLGAAGLSYVHFKNQQHSTGGEVKMLERQLADLATQNDVVRTKISRLSARSYLQRRLADGFIRMAPITDDRIVHVSAESLRTVNEVRAVANQIVQK